MPAFLIGAWAILKSLPALVGSVWNLLMIGIEIAKWVRSIYERSERAAVVKEVKEAIRESRVSLDNSKLLNLLSRKPSEPK